MTSTHGGSNLGIQHSSKAKTAQPSKVASRSRLILPDTPPQLRRLRVIINDLSPAINPSRTRRESVSSTEADNFKHVNWDRIMNTDASTLEAGRDPSQLLVPEEVVENLQQGFPKYQLLAAFAPEVVKREMNRPIRVKTANLNSQHRARSELDLPRLPHCQKNGT